MIFIVYLLLCVLLFIIGAFLLETRRAYGLRKENQLIRDVANNMMHKQAECSTKNGRELRQRANGLKISAGAIAMDTTKPKDLGKEYIGGTEIIPQFRVHGGGWYS